MGLLQSIGKALEQSAERSRERQASRHTLEDLLTVHNREHRDNLVLVNKAEVERQPRLCPTGLYGWKDMLDTPFGVSVRLCSTCGQYHVKEGSA